MMPRLLASVPPSVHVELVSDRSQSIRDSVHDVQFTLMLTIGLVVMVIFIFLRHLWATIIPVDHRAAVAGRHVRRDVRGSATASTISR